MERRSGQEDCTGALFVFVGLVSGGILKFVVCLDKGQTKGGHWEI